LTGNEPAFSPIFQLPVGAFRLPLRFELHNLLGALLRIQQLFLDSTQRYWRIETSEGGFHPWRLKFYSGMAIYTNSFDAPTNLTAKSVWLDLGDVRE